MKESKVDYMERFGGRQRMGKVCNYMFDTKRIF